MQFKEVEFKYRADEISLTQFTDFCKGRAPDRFVMASGWDYFYDSETLEGFCRHRVGPDMNQLTFKRKLTAANNYVRTEHNLDLAPGMSVAAVSALCQEFGYKHNVTLYKNCFIYGYDWYTLVYYLVYDREMKELGRFLEIEMREDYTWNTEQDAWDALVVMEKLCKPLGISPQSRVKRSLFEMFKEESKK